MMEMGKVWDGNELVNKPDGFTYYTRTTILMGEEHVLILDGTCGHSCCIGVVHYQTCVASYAVLDRSIIRWQVSPIILYWTGPLSDVVTHAVWD